jgi:anaerobic selenocysteine-containing dehydrogenase
MHLGHYDDETSFLCQWHIPQTHLMESWSDLRAYDGTISIIQPLIAPLYPSKTDHEILAFLLGQEDASNHEIVRQYWSTRHGAENFEEFWQRALEKGVVDKIGDAASFKLAASPFSPSGTLEGAAPSQPLSSSALEIVFRPDPSVWDGRFANNGWLQELPRPMTKLVWDNAAMISAATAARLGVSNGGIVKLLYRGRELRIPVWVLAGQADETVTVHLGYGRTRAGRVGNGVGFNAYAIRASDHPWFDSGLLVEKSGQTHLLVATSAHHTMESRALTKMHDEVIAGPGGEENAHDNRKLVRVADVQHFKEHPNFVKEMEAHKSAL